MNKPDTADSKAMRLDLIVWGEGPSGGYVITDQSQQKLSLPISHYRIDKLSVGLAIQ